MATDRRRALGARGEQAVAVWYRDAGYELLAANWRCSEGEIDLVLESPVGDLVVFCEVKSRTSSRFGTGFDAVTVAKQRRLRRLAARWLAERRSTAPKWRGTREVRFDVAAVIPEQGGGMRVEVLEGAF
ncbi:MAG: YraN family protein [Acidimicrobiales bacterium]